MLHRMGFLLKHDLANVPTQSCKLSQLLSQWELCDPPGHPLPGHQAFLSLEESRVLATCVSKKTHSGSPRDGLRADEVAAKNWEKKVRSPGAGGIRKHSPWWQPSKTTRHESVPRHPILAFVGSWLTLLSSLPSNQFLLWIPKQWQRHLRSDRAREHIHS